LLARALDGAVFLEVNPDTYGWQKDTSRAVAAHAERESLQTLLVADVVEEIVAKKEGLARRIDVPVAPRAER